MAKKQKKEEVVPDAPNIKIEQIIAALIAKFGPVLISPDLLLMDYSKYSVQINQDEKTNLVMLALVETESASANGVELEVESVEE